MPRKVFIILGNGFTMDFVSSYLGSNDKIDVSNLFQYGSHVPWPSDGMPGFLSFKHCPNLWNLGARPSMSKDAAMGLIEDIITCMNVYSMRTTPNKGIPNGKPNDIYLYAYKELLLYLKYLFVFYNNKIATIPDDANNWHWITYLKYINDSPDVESITIVTYNYDIWVERLFQKLAIQFSVGVIPNGGAASKITILKPHGSISFVHKNELPIDSFAINYDTALRDCEYSDFNVSYIDLDKHYLITALIPPAGESARMNHSWASKLREEARVRASELKDGDDVITCGISYWHVDRAELDELFVSFSPEVNLMQVNPSPTRSLDAVLTSVFNYYISYPSAMALKERVK